MFASFFRVRGLSKRLLGRIARAVPLASLGLLAVPQVLLGADEIILTYGYFERRISVEELAAFATGGGLSPQLAKYAATFQLSEADLAAARNALNEEVELSQTVLAQFLYTVQGETILENLGEIIQTPARQSGAQPIRAAAILAAADDENGLTLLNFLRKYPTAGIRFNVRRGLDIASRAIETLGQAEKAIALVQQIAEAEAQGSDDSLLGIRVLLSNRPPYTVTRRQLDLPLRRVRATLFLPQPSARALPDQIPVIVISHGLGDARTSYSYLAEYLAARGFAVATLDHPGSNGKQITDLLSGLSPDLVDNQEFFNRPGDVSALLDEIQGLALADPVYQQRLNLQNVGVVGQSFGGYTALALGGATLDPQALTAACQPQTIYLNPSLLLQCQAEAATAEPVSLKDDRIQAVLAINPIGSALFGKAGYGQLDVPVMLVAATADTIAPALPEQIEPFTWLQTPERYLALTGRTTHFSMIAAGLGPTPIPVPFTLEGGNSVLAQRYLQTFSLAFFQKHLRQNLDYAPALTARYMQLHVEQSPLQPLSFIRELTPESLAQVLNSDD